MRLLSVGGRDVFVRPREPVRSGRADHLGEHPTTRHALQLIRSPLGELVPRADDKISHSSGDEDAAAFRRGHHPRRDVDCESPERSADKLDFPCVYSRADRDPTRSERLLQASGARHCPRRAVKSGEETVARMVDLAATVGVELFAHDIVVLLDELHPGGVASFGCEVRRVDDVSDHHRRKLAVQDRHGPRSSQELLHLAEQQSEVAGADRKRVRARQLDVPCAWNLLGEVTAERCTVMKGIAALEHERRHAYRRENRSDVELSDPPVHRRRRAAGHPEALVSSEPPSEARIVRRSWRGERENLARHAVVLLVAVDELFGRLVRHSDRIVVGAPPASEAVYEGQRRDSIRMGGGKHHRHRAALGIPEEGSTLDLGGIHHDLDVVHPFLEPWEVAQGHGVGDAGSALVETENPREPRQPLEVRGHRGLLPHGVAVRDPVRHEHEVYGPGAEELVGDITAFRRFRVTSFGTGHVVILVPARPARASSTWSSAVMIASPPARATAIAASTLGRIEPSASSGNSASAAATDSSDSSSSSAVPKPRRTAPTSVRITNLSASTPGASRADARSLSITASTPWIRLSRRTTGIPPPPQATARAPESSKERICAISTTSSGAGEGTARRHPRPCSSTSVQPRSCSRLRACSAE